MKVLVYGYTPPPHHGQSYMVKLLLDGFGGDVRKGGKPNEFGIECYHVNARLVTDVDDSGRFRWKKLFDLLGYLGEAVYCRFRYGVKVFYYYPAHAMKLAVIRDWAVMIVCRLFFRHLVVNWQAAGLAEWLETQPCKWLRRITFFLMRPDVSIPLAEFNVADANQFRPRKTFVVNNGIPDPCPDFESRVLPLRKQRRAQLQQALKGAGETVVVPVLYMSLCMKEKGLHDAVAGIHLANLKLAEKKQSVRFELTVAGKFFNTDEETAFHELLEKLGLQNVVRYAGFLSGEDKVKALTQSDLFCFPTYYYAEGQPVALIEVMAYGMPIVTTRWRSVPELFEADYPGLVEVQNPRQVADALVKTLEIEPEQLRKRFLQRYTVEAYLSGIAKALHSLK